MTTTREMTSPEAGAGQDVKVRRRSRWRTLGLVVLALAMVEGLFAWLDARALATQTQVLDWGKMRAIALEEARPGRHIKWVPWGDVYAYSDGYLERRAYAYDVDDQGFLMPSGSHARPDASIIFQGGSTTEIVYVDPEVRFAALSGKLIEQRTGLKINTFNAGVSGSSTLDSINSLINKMAALQPTFVVMMEDINDLNTLIYNHNSYYGKVRGTIGEIEQRRGRRERSIVGTAGELADVVVTKTIPHVWARLTGLASMLTGSQSSSDEFAAVRNERRRVDPEAIRAAFRRNLTIYVQTARAYGITPILMTQASRFYDDSADWQSYISREIEAKTKLPFDAYRELHRSMNQVTREVGQTQNVLVIDLEKRIEGRSRYIHDPVHFNNHGSRLAARIISDEIVERYFQQRRGN
jgi:lysophospholipase L1-like esterase